MSFIRLSYVCRVCLKEETGMQPLFNQYATENPVEALRAAVNLEYLQNDELPNLICPECLKKAQECLAFQQQCIVSERLFQHILKQKEDKLTRLNTSDIPMVTAQPITCTESVPKDLKIEFQQENKTAAEEEMESYISYSDDNSKCQICKYTFVNDAKLKRHMKIHSNSDPETVEWSEMLASTVRTLHFPKLGKRKPQTNFNCSICGIRSLTLQLHKKHLRQHKGPQKFPCTFCGKVFNHGDYLRIHRRIHTNERRYKCTICDKRFVQHASWKSHEITHSDTLNHVCEVCGKNYKRALSLKRHFESTHEIQKHRCSFCNKEFRLKSILSKHMKIHTNSKTYNCEVCGKTFRRKDTLTTHSKIHSGDKPHACSICGKEFVQKHALQSHMKSHDVVMTDSIGVDQNNSYQTHYLSHNNY